MNKSTPLSELPNIKKQNSPAYEEKENQIVSEILNEIDNSQEKDNIDIHVNPQQPAPVQQPVQQEQMMEQQRIIQEHQLISNKRMEDSINKTLSEDDFFGNAIEMFKQPAIVALVVAIVSLPYLDNILKGLVSNREKIAKYSAILLPLMKAVLGGGIYFGINRSIE
jgi:hypothetical protein